MKILLVNNRLTIAKMPPFFRMERDYLISKGYDVYTYSWGDVSDCNKNERMYVCPEPKSNIGQCFYKYVFRKRLLKQFSEFVDNIKPDVIHLHLIKYPMSVFPVVKDYPAILTLHGPNYICANGWGCHYNDGQSCNLGIGWQCYKNGCVPLWHLIIKSFSYKRYLRSLMNNIKQFLFPAQHLEKTFRLFGFSNTRFLPIAANPLFLSLLPGGYPRKKQVLFVGTLHEVKGVEILFDAFRKVLQRIPDAKLLYVGEGNKRETIENLISDNHLSDSVSLLGFKDHSSLIGLYRESAMTVVPSVWKETFPQVVLESLTLGTPCIGSDIGGIPEQLHDGEFGFLVPPGDSELLSEKICFLLDNPSIAERMGNAGRAFMIKTYNACQYLETLEDIIRNVADNP